MKNEEHRYCPQHGNPENPWGHCDIAYEDSPDDLVTCPWFVQEMDRRIKDVTDYGNYYELVPHEPGQPRLVQEYRNHEPYGGPRPLGTRE